MSVTARGLLVGRIGARRVPDQRIVNLELPTIQEAAVYD
jgi:hypothetical protein